MTTYQDKHAFPIVDAGHGSPFDRGMTLRDYFAAKAMQGLLAGLQDGERFSLKSGASYCYEIADAMLKARE